MTNTAQDAKPIHASIPGILVTACMRTDTDVMDRRPYSLRSEVTCVQCLAALKPAMV